MKRHKDYREKLALYVYDELNAAERGELETHLQTCPACREELQQLQVLRQSIPEKPLIEPDEATLQSLRNMVSYKIRSEKPRPAGLGNFFISFLKPAPALRVGFALAVFVLGFFLGRQELSPQQDNSDAILQDLLTANRQVQSGSSTVNPLLASVERINYDPQSGNIEIYYTTVNDIRLKGKADNAAIRQLLREAILEDQNPAVRLHAVKTAESIAETRSGLDQDIVQALAFLLEKEQNPGLRLKVLRTLSAQMPDPQVKSTLIRILLNDPNPALRIAALEGLLAHPFSGADIDILKTVARRDPNSFIQSRAEKKIRDHGGTAPGDAGWPEI